MDTTTRLRLEKRLARPEEVAEALGIGRTRIYQLLASGDLPSVKIGKLIRVEVGALEQWIRAHQR